MQNFEETLTVSIFVFVSKFAKVNELWGRVTCFVILVVIIIVVVAVAVVVTVANVHVLEMKNASADLVLGW